MHFKVKNIKRHPRLQALFERKADSGGWSLPGTLCMMTIISLFLAAMYNTLIPIYRHVMGVRYKDVARAVNEGALDTILAQINSSTYSPPTTVGQSATVSSSQTIGGATFNSVATITNLGSGGLGTGGPPKNSIVYASNNPAVNIFYSMTVKTSTGPLSRTITVLMAPVPNSAPGNVNGFLQPWQLSGALGLSTVNEVGLACVNGYNLPAGWNNPYQFGDTTVAKGITWQIGNGDTSRSQIIAGSQFEFWHPGNSPPVQPPGTVGLTYENFTIVNVPAGAVLVQNGVTGQDDFSTVVSRYLNDSSGRFSRSENSRSPRFASMSSPCAS